MRRLVQFLLGGLPTTPEAARALDATLADWRHEAANATTLIRRLRVVTVGAWSVTRVLVVSGLRELPHGWSAPYLWRTALLLCTILLGAAWFDPPLRFVGVLSTGDLIVLALFRAAPVAVILLPVAAFVSEAVGSRTRVGPTLGALVIMTVVAALAMTSYPEFYNYERHVTWRQFANAATPPPVAFPSVFRIPGGEGTLAIPPAFWIWFGLNCALLAAATASLSVLAYQVRRRPGIGAWVLGLLPFVSLAVATGAVMFSVARFGPEYRDLYALYPPVGSVVVLLSLAVLPLALAGYLAQRTHRREAASGSAVPS